MYIYTVEVKEKTGHDRRGGGWYRNGLVDTWGKKKRNLIKDWKEDGRKCDGANSVEKRKTLKIFVQACENTNLKTELKEKYIINKLLEGEEEKDLVPDVFVSIRTASIGLKSRSSFLFRRD